ncbi:MAG: hypothetical protein CMH54_08250 [Myxococcales bacterium]|nr:hypothetical protein [Myxococcales bacterium]
MFVGFLFTLFGIVVLGWLIGGNAEKRHLRKLAKAFEESGELMTEVRSFPGGAIPTNGAEMVVSEVVIANDYLKSFLASLRNIIGGEIHSYRNLMMRARQEAVLRLLHQAREKGLDSVCNIRLEFCKIGLGFSVLASGTAYKRQESISS